MVKSKKVLIVIVISMIGAALLTGCDSEVREETGLKSKAELSDSEAVEATVTGNVKEVDGAAEQVTITAEDGAELVLKVASRELLDDLDGLTRESGLRVTVDYDKETKTAVNVSTTGETRATINTGGILKAVDAAAGTIIIVTQSGDELVLKVTEESKIVSGSLLTLAQLAAKIDSQVGVEYYFETKTVTVIDIQD
ncbi:MAG: hypothetical protein ACOWWO_20025 [Peptococcaceae bacterium]